MYHNATLLDRINFDLFAYKCKSRAIPMDLFWHVCSDYAYYCVISIYDDSKEVSKNVG